MRPEEEKTGIQAFSWDHFAGSKFFYLHLLFISIALLLRVWASCYLDLVNYPDSETYELLALQSYNGLPITLPTRPLGYPFFLSWIYNALGPSRHYAVYAQHLLGAISYLLFYSILLHIFGRKLLSALFAFAIVISWNMMIYERAILSDFMNHFLLLLSIFIMFRYFKSGKAYLMAPLALSSVAASAVRPTSDLLAAIVLATLAMELLISVVKKRGLSPLKSIVIYASVLVVLTAGFNLYSVKKTGFKGGPAGVLGVTMLIRTADFIEYYSSPLHADAKAQMRVMRNAYLVDYVPEYANFLMGYKFYTTMSCGMDDATKKAYAATTMSAERFYGAHPVGPGYFNTHDLLRELKCDLETIDRVVFAITREAVFSNFIPFMGSVLDNLMGFVERKPWEYRAFIAFASGGGATMLAGFLSINQSLDQALSNSAVSLALTLVFIACALAFFFLEKDKGRMKAVAFLLAFILLNYLSLAVIADHPAGRYKVPFWWMQLPLLVYFIMLIASRAARAKQRRISQRLIQSEGAGAPLRFNLPTHGYCDRIISKSNLHEGIITMETGRSLNGSSHLSKKTIFLMSTVFAINFLSLVYQVIWTRKIMVVFGTTALSISTILTVFLAGIALGGYLGGGWIKKAGNKYRFLGMLLAALGLYCLLATFMLGYIREPFLYLTGVADAPFASNLIKLSLSFIILIIPTTIIGATFPIITYLYAVDFKRFGRDVALIYFLDTLGAAAGAIVCGFYLVPRIGLREASSVGAIIYMALGLVIILLKKGTDYPATPAPDLAPRPRLDSTRAFVLAALFFSGFAALVLEVTWSRFFHLLFGTSIYAFSLVLAAFLLGLSVGSAAIKRYLDRFKNPILIFAYIEMLIAVFALITIHTNSWIENVYFKYFYEMSNFYAFQALLFAIAFILMLIPTSLMGANFPLAVRIFSRSRETRADDAGVTFSVNTAGGIAGAFLAGFIILPLLGLENTNLLASAIYFLIGLGFLFAAKSRGAISYAFAAAAAAVLIFAGFVGKEPSLNYSIYYEGVRHGSMREFLDSKNRVKTLYSKHGHYGLVSVNYDPPTGNIFLLNNGKTDASIHPTDMGTQVMLGHLPLFLHRNPEDILNIGLGGGFTLGANITHPDVKSVDMIEIDPLVFEAAEMFFSPYNNNALADPRVVKHVQDGRHFVETTQKKYDVIISEPPNIWVSGVSQLFTDEFYRSAKKRLKEGGILTQWSPAYELDMADLKLILATIKGRFKYVMFWSNNVDFMIIASDDPIEPDYRRVAALMDVPAIHKSLDHIIKGIDAPMMMRILSNPAVGPDTMPAFLKDTRRVNRDNLPYLEFKTARNIFNNSRKR